MAMEAGNGYGNYMLEVWVTTKIYSQGVNSGLERWVG